MISDSRAPAMPFPEGSSTRPRKSTGRAATSGESAVGTRLIRRPAAAERGELFGLGLLARPSAAGLACAVAALAVGF